MRRTLEAGWGPLGGRVADTWRDFNRAHFGGRLRPLPIFLTPSTPYGNRLGWTCCREKVTHIALAAPSQGKVLVADRGVLLHEMIHQLLHETGECIRHAGEPWCREIMRLHRMITGSPIWAARTTVVKVRTADGGRASRRINPPHPDTGEPSLTQAEIARWPYSVGLDFGKL
jgi:hypothetical protein